MTLGLHTTNPVLFQEVSKATTEELKASINEAISKVKTLIDSK